MIVKQQNLINTKMSDQSNLQAHYKEFCNSTTVNIITPILNYVNTNKQPFTLEQLLAVCNLPPTKSSGKSHGKDFSGAVVPPMAVSNTDKSASAVHCKTCVYQYVRGDNRGNLCGKRVVAGYDYCGSCLKRGTVKRELSTNGITPGAAPGAIPGLSGMPSEDQSASDEKNGLSVTEYDKERGYFLDHERNFIVHETVPGSGNIFVIGKHDSETNSIVPLTEQEEIIAKNIGLILPPDNILKGSTSQTQNKSETQSVPSVPKVGTVHSVVPGVVPSAHLPTVQPIVNKPTVTVPPAVPGAIPQIPSLN